MRSRTLRATSTAPGVLVDLAIGCADFLEDAAERGDRVIRAGDGESGFRVGTCCSTILSQDALHTGPDCSTVHLLHGDEWVAGYTRGACATGTRDPAGVLGGRPSEAAMTVTGLL
jgi:hypothetical protein